MHSPMKERSRWWRTRCSVEGRLARTRQTSRSAGRAARTGRRAESASARARRACRAGARGAAARRGRPYSCSRHRSPAGPVQRSRGWQTCAEKYG